MMFRTVAAFVFLLGAGAAQADDAKPAAPAAPADVLKAMRADPHVIKAMEFMTASGSKDYMLQRQDMLVDTLLNGFRKSKTGVPDKVWDVVSGTVKDELHANSDDLLLMSAKLYSEHFTDAELDQLIAFYKSDIVVKYLHERPSLAKDEAAVGKAWAERMLPDLADKIQKKIQEMTAKPEQKT